jgi:hypothetical protein
MKHPYNLSNYIDIDGQCSESEKKRIENHIETCSDCQKFIQTYSSIQSEMTSLAGYPVPNFFATRVLVKAREQARDSLWTAFEFVPKKLVRALVVMSAIVIVITSFPFQSESSLEEQSLLPVADVEMTANLESNDDVLQFALNMPEE